MYFLLAGAIGRFHMLRYGLAVILIFVGLKMSWLNALWAGHFPRIAHFLEPGAGMAREEYRKIKETPAGGEKIFLVRHPCFSLEALNGQEKPTTPVPAALSRSAANPDVRVSCMDSSG
jgi:hypothetical protein